jgi:hypothetical protein
MQTVDDKPETIHLYVVREDDRQPPSSLPVILTVLCFLVIISVTVYSGNHPYYEHQTLRIPAQFLPLQTFSTIESIIPTGKKTYAATTAHGTLTVTNGSVIAATLPKGIIFTGKSGVEVVTDEAVFVPAGSAAGYGYATVSAHAMVRGKSGNIPAYDINRVEGSSIYIRNLTPFHGGKDSYSVPFQLPQDKRTAIDAARAILTAQEAKIQAFLAYPCHETTQVKHLVVGLSWTCQFVTYHIPAFYHVTGVRIIGKNLLIDVWFIARPSRIWVK